MIRDHELGPVGSRRDHYEDWARNVMHAFVDAMRPSLVVPVVALALGSASCLLIRRRGSGQGRPSAAPTSTPARRIAAS